MAKIIRRILLVLAVALVGAQFVPVNRKNPASDPAKDYLSLSQAPTDVASLMRAACYDCHSHQTKYPWYSYIAPVSFWIANHIKEGRDHLNFATWSDYPADKAAHKLEECYEEVEQGHMPIDSYTWMHKEAKLSDAQRAKLVEWFKMEYAKTK
jgi:Haem-binding domain